jgi:Rps23 Pro-64 3,4-dihydroxylase Tpa1-like proline 4-hydroxylase
LSARAAGDSNRAVTEFHLNPCHDAAALAGDFAAASRLQISDFLRHDGAMTLFRELMASREWALAVNKGEEVSDFRADEVASWPQEKRDALDAAVVAGGRQGFQFRYETIRLPEYGSGLKQDPPAALRDLIDFLNRPELIHFFRTLTGIAEIDFVDGHASRYSDGHFLTSHDDRNDDMSRRAAYVVNLTPQWRPDWGGILQFYDERANVVRGFTPAFNTLNIFAVPQPHSVSWVTPLAGAQRYAVTGWLRTRG